MNSEFSEYFFQLWSDYATQLLSIRLDWRTRRKIFLTEELEDVTNSELTQNNHETILQIIYWVA